MLEIRAEIAGDAPFVHAVNVSAFPTRDEADLVDVLRDNADPVISLVAVQDGRIVGHIMFSPVELRSNRDLKIMGLGPMAVSPDEQSRGIGARLVSEGLVRCKDTGAGAVVVLGHPTYYPRFGFAPASERNIRCEYDVPDDTFMIIELTKDYLSGAEGIVRYHEAFGDAT